MNHQARQPTTEELQQALRELCLEQTQALYACLGEAVTSLLESNHLGALGALDGADQRLLELLTVLKLVQRLAYRKNR